MKQLFTVLGALALGAGAMYYLDPEQGRRRRALVGDKVDSVTHDTRDYVQSRRKQTADRVRGLFARMRSRLRSEPPTDQQLYGQIRARLGRAVSYPHAIETDVQQGRVILRGDVLEGEYNLLMAEIWSMPGVKAIDSQLSQHAESGTVPSLQGRPRRTGRARLRHFARNAAATLALTGGIGAGIKALRRQAGGTSIGMLSLAIALLAYGVGDGARLVRQRRQWRGKPSRAARPAEAGAEQAPPERAAEATPALLSSTAAWH